MGRRDGRVPNTISDEQMRDLQRRAAWAARRESVVDKQATRRRLAQRAIFRAARRGEN